MKTYPSNKGDEKTDPNVLIDPAMMLSLEDEEQSSPSANGPSYGLDYSLIAIVFAIILFLWMQ